VWESCIINCAHTLRKLRQYTVAIKYYQKVLQVTCKNAEAYSGLAFTYHLHGNLDSAIDAYHQALGIKPDDSFTTEMLNRALNDAYQ